MRFLVDAQLPPALAAWLGEQGFSATAARDVGLRDSDDGSIVDFAVGGQWTVITKDEDFATRCIDDPAALPWYGFAWGTAPIECCLPGLNLACLRFNAA